MYNGLLSLYYCGTYSQFFKKIIFQQNGSVFQQNNLEKSGMQAATGPKFQYAFMPFENMSFVSQYLFLNCCSFILLKMLSSSSHPYQKSERKRGQRYLVVVLSLLRVP